MSSTSGPQQFQPGSSPYQERLTNFCRSSGIRPPSFQVVSDRRGGRTAWSCVVNVQGQQLQARFWYDGQYVQNAVEDAAQVALQRLGQLPAAGATAPGQTQQQQNQQSPSSQQSSQQSTQQQRNYGVIGS